MRFLIGSILFLLGAAGIAGAVYTGMFIMFIGGIINVIDAAKVTPVDGSGVAFGIVKVIFASLVGTLLGYVSFGVMFIGMVVMGGKK